MLKEEMTMIRLRKTTLKKLRHIGNRNMTDDQVIEMMSNNWHMMDEVVSQTIIDRYNGESL